MHPLTILASGLYGRALPPQDGAPLRLVVPWKYGFKGVKSIVKITLVDKSAADHLEPQCPERVRVLRQRQSPARPSPLEPGERAADRREWAAPDADVQRIRKSRLPVSTRAWIWTRFFEAANGWKESVRR